MTFAGSRLLLVVLLAFATAACQTEDKPAQPGFTSYARDEGMAVPTPSGTRSAAVADAGKSSQRSANQYFIEFRSRYALSYGHSYVIFGRSNQAGEMVDPEVAGLASEVEKRHSLRSRPFLASASLETGWSDGDLEEEYRSASWRVMLNEAQYRKAVAYIRQLQESSPVWHAIVYNCNAFVADIAKSMGYKTPPSGFGRNNS